MIPTGSITLAAVWMVALVAQTPAPAPAAPSPQQPIRTTTLLVEVDTIVTDGKGQFVTGLTADDFDVLEDGKPQKIERIYTVTGTTVTASSVIPPAPAEAADAPPLPATAPPRTFVLLLDQEHLQEGAFKRLRDAAVTFLTSEFKSGDVGGVVIGSAMAGNRLTTDREELLAAVRSAKATAAQTSRRLDLMEWPRFNGETEAIRIALMNDRDVLAKVVQRACDDDPNACRPGRDAVEPLVMNKARTVVGELRPPAMRTIRTLQALASGLARLPGRKTIVLMTEGFFVEESWADLRQIVGVAARSNVRIYSLDGRGLDTRQVNDVHQLSVMDPGGSAPLDAYNTVEDGPNMLAVDTGGYAIRHTNKFAEALAEIARDTSNYYVIGYSPTNAANDGSFRKITVRTKRPGLRVRARRGYLAIAGGPGTSARTEKPVALQPAMSSPGAEAATRSSPVEPPGASPPDSAKLEPKTPPETSNRAAGFILRPDAIGRVDELASAEGEHDKQGLASRGWERYQKGDLEGAAELLGAAAADPNAHPWIHYALGYSQLALRHPETAAQSWEKVRAAVPEFRAVYLDLGDAYMQMENYSRAIEVLKAGDARWPGDSDVLNAMGTIQVRRGALDDAVNTFRKATAAKPDEALAYFNLGRTYELRYFKRRRYSPTDARWLADPADLKSAIASYEQYLKLGGPYEAQARTAIHNLQWQK